MNESERAAAVAERVVEDTFLSPRVVDAAALTEFAQSLGELLRRAAEQREHLRRTVAEGESVAATLRDTTGQAAEKLRPALKLLPTIDQKLAQADQSLARAAKAAETAEHAAGAAAKAATDEGVVALQSARRALDESMHRARNLEARLGQLTQRAEMAVELLDSECKTRLEAAARHAQDVLGSTTSELDARADATLERLTTLIDERRAAAEAALTAPLAVGAPGDGGAQAEAFDADAIAESTRAAEAARAELESLLAEVRQENVRRQASLETQTAEAERRAAEAAAKADAAEQLAQAAEARLEAVRRSLAEIDDRGRQIAEMAGQALAAFDEELTSRMHAMRELMEQIAGVTDSQTPAPQPDAPESAEPDAPTAMIETKPARDPSAFIRIDRPMQSDAPAGLPGHLRF